MHKLQAAQSKGTYALRLLGRDCGILTRSLRVKCDEDRPACENCVRFEIPCRYRAPVGVGAGTSAEAGVGSPSVTEKSSTPPRGNPPRRGRGRPRKDWAAITPEESCSSPPSLLSLSPASSSQGPCTLNVRDSELLLHYVSTTAATFVSGGPSKPDDPIVNFWTRNVPQIGLSHHFVLHLSFAIAAYHLSRLHPDAPEHGTYTTLAAAHLSTGLAEMTPALARLDDENCGALYVAATLVCYCNFAAGPSGPSDLLLCDVDGSGAGRWSPLIRGLTYIRQAARPEVLWSGLMAPLGPALGEESSHKPPPPAGPTFAREGFPRIDWVGHFDRLRELVSREDVVNGVVYVHCFEDLRGIYAATYGDDDGEYDGPPDNAFVHGWLYRARDEYVACLRRREPLALILLAHFALLLRTMKEDWYLDRWAEHLLERTRRYTPTDLEEWIRWPTEQAGLEWIGRGG